MPRPAVFLSRPVRVIFWTLFVASLLAKSVRADGDVPAKVPLELQPYVVKLLVAFDSAIISEHQSQRLQTEIRQTADRCVGSLWNLDVQAVSWLSPINPDGLDRLNQSSVSQVVPGESADILFITTVESISPGIRVSMRSWEPEVRSETNTISAELSDLRDVPVTILRLCRELFRPIGAVEQVEERSVRMRLRGGEIVPPDPSFAPLAPGDIVVPLMAYRDKNNIIQKLQPIPWTYISAEHIEGSTIEGTIQSGLRSPLGVKKRGRVDTLLVAIRPQHSSTRLQLVTQAKTPLTLIGHRIEVRTQPIIPRPSKEDPDADPSSTLIRELITDRRGMTTIPVESDRSLVWLFVYSGDQQLARVPLVPGIDPQVRLEVPDDTARLTAEADLQMLQGEVIDAVALRNTAFSTIRTAAKADNWPLVGQKIRLLKQLPNSNGLMERLNAIRVTGTDAAKKRKDRVAEVRINRICDDTTTLIQAHLSDDKVRLLVEEMEALKNASEAIDKAKAAEENSKADAKQREDESPKAEAKPE